MDPAKPVVTASFAALRMPVMGAGLGLGLLFYSRPFNQGGLELLSEQLPVDSPGGKV